MRAHFQGALNHYNIKWRMEIVVPCLVPLRSLLWQCHCAHFFLHCVRTVIVCRLRCDNSWRVCQGRHQQSLNHVIRFCVQIAFLVTEIFVFCIQAKVCFVFRQKCVLYSGKSDLLLAFAQQHGVISSEIFGKWGCGGLRPHLKRGDWGAKPPAKD